jgi:methylated-DNA-protein-cysteine methyltransferase-like protein
MKKDSYYDMVYYITQKIPYGRVSTYGAIADYLTLGSARMVGWALTQCNQQGAGDIPAHRVVNSKGELSGRMHFNPPSSMQSRLESEGVKVENDRVVQFKNLFWHPQELDEV